jgi:hypothetical protein
LIEGYKVIAAKEKLERDRKKYPLMKRRNFNLANTDLSSSSVGSNLSTNSISSLLHSDKYGILSPLQKKLQSTSAASEQVLAEEQFKALVKPSVVVESFESLPSDFYSKELNINSSNFQISNILCIQTYAYNTFMHIPSYHNKSATLESRVSTGQVDRVVSVE